VGVRQVAGVTMNELYNVHRYTVASCMEDVMATAAFYVGYGDLVGIHTGFIACSYCVGHVRVGILCELVMRYVSGKYCRFGKSAENGFFFAMCMGMFGWIHCQSLSRD
jgi:hypothetical protein